MAKKRKVADSEVDGVQLEPSDPQPSGTLNHDQPRGSWPKRIGAGKGRAIQQLEKCGDAIIHAVPKCIHMTAPPSEPVNKMAPSLKQQRQRSKVQSAKGKGKVLLVSSIHSNLSIIMHATENQQDPLEMPNKYTQKPIFQAGDQSSHFGFKVSERAQSNL